MTDQDQVAMLEQMITRAQKAGELARSNIGKLFAVRRTLQQIASTTEFSAEGHKQCVASVNALLTELNTP